MKQFTIILSLLVVGIVVYKIVAIRTELGKQVATSNALYQQSALAYQSDLSGEWWFQVSAMLGAANPLGELESFQLF